MSPSPSVPPSLRPSVPLSLRPSVPPSLRPSPFSLAGCQPASLDHFAIIHRVCLPPSPTAYLPPSLPLTQGWPRCGEARTRASPSCRNRCLTPRASRVSAPSHSLQYAVAPPPQQARRLVQHGFESTSYYCLHPTPVLSRCTVLAPVLSRCTVLASCRRAGPG